MFKKIFCNHKYEVLNKPDDQGYCQGKCIKCGIIKHIHMDKLLMKGKINGTCWLWCECGRNLFYKSATTELKIKPDQTIYEYRCDNCFKTSYFDFDIAPCAIQVDRYGNVLTEDKCDNSLNIGIDIDGTITEPYSILPILCDHTGEYVSEEECVDYDLSKVFKTKFSWDDKWENSLHEDLTLREAFLVSSKLRAGVKDNLDILSVNNNIRFITARKLDTISKKYTYKLLIQNNIRAINIDFTGNHNKIAECEKYEIDVMIEDSPKNALQLANAGIKVILIDTYYNRGIDHELIYRVTTWDEIPLLIESFK